MCLGQCGALFIVMGKLKFIPVRKRHVVGGGLEPKCCGHPGSKLESAPPWQTTIAGFLNTLEPKCRGQPVSKLGSALPWQTTIADFLS